MSGAYEAYLRQTQEEKEQEGIALSEKPEPIPQKEPCLIASFDDADLDNW